ncbi:MAG: hypothetical protein AB7Q17_08115 [Phycisphaerae bacterium]
MAKSRCVIAGLLASGAAVVTGCGSMLDPAIWHMKRAAPFKIAQMWEPSTERPARDAIEGVQRYGRDRYVRRMRKLLPYPIAVHALGWYGDLWDLHAIAPQLSATDADARRVALAAFSRPSGEPLADEAAAIGWWEKNRASIPPPR